MRKFTSYFLIFQLFFSTHSFAGNKKAEKQEEKAVTESTILLIAAAYAGITISTSCEEPSAMLFGVGALYYVYGEIKNWNNFKEASDLIVKEYKNLDTEKYEKQIVALNKAEEETREAENAARERAGNAESAATIWTIAAVIAIIEFILRVIPWIEYDDACEGSDSSSFISPPFFQSITDFILPKLHAEADTDKARLMGITSPESVAKLAAAGTGLTMTMSSARQSGLVRAIIFGAFALLANQVAKMTNEAADTYKRQADEYAKLRQKMIDSLPKVSLEKFADFELELAELKKERLALKESRNCATNTSNATFKMDKNCDCKKNQTCKDVSFPKIEMKEFSLPGSVNSGIKTYSNMSSAGYSSNASKADLAQGDLKNQAAAIRRFKSDLEVAANESLTKNGNSPVNFKEQEKLMADKIKNLIKNGLTKEGQSLFSTGLGSSISLEKSSEKDIKQEAKELTTQIRKLNAPIKMSSKKGGKKSDPFTSFFLKTEEENQEELDQGTALSQYKTNENDINNKKSESIFKIISIRYIKTAFPILFNE